MRRFIISFNDGDMPFRDQAELAEIGVESHRVVAIMMSVRKLGAFALNSIADDYHKRHIERL